MHEKCEEKTSQINKSNNTVNYILLGVVGMLLVGAVLQAMTIGQVIGDLQQGGVSMTGLAVSTAGGETYEQMMARMHPDQVQQQTAASAGSGMVGGC